MISKRLRQAIWERPSFILAVLLPSIVVPHILDLGYWRTDFEPGKVDEPVELQAAFAKVMNEWLETMRN